jgi:hypothetical protein
LLLNDPTFRNVLARFARAHQSAIVQCARSLWEKTREALHLSDGISDCYVTDVFPANAPPPRLPSVKDPFLGQYHGKEQLPLGQLEGTIVTLREANPYRLAGLTLLADRKYYSMLITDPDVYEYAYQALQSSTPLLVRYLDLPSLHRRDVMELRKK